uniref:Palmitoyltransferase n=1 Tax=Podarcis muralis TaxID=64176 RepID=A0A670KF68_PODMU
MRCSGLPEAVQSCWPHDPEAVRRLPWPVKRDERRNSRAKHAKLPQPFLIRFGFQTLGHLGCPPLWLALHVSWAFPTISGLLFIPTIIYFLLTSFTDTGILHKGIEEELVNQAFTMKDLNQHWCNKCQLYCLQHTFHCSWCNTCVEEFDHHCMWVNNCIGYHNLRFFIFFVAFLSGYDLAVLASCLVYLAFNSQQVFSVEKICTVLVTIPAAFYLVPLLLLVCTQIRYILAAHHSCKFQVLRADAGANMAEAGGEKLLLVSGAAWSEFLGMQSTKGWWPELCVPLFTIACSQGRVPPNLGELPEPLTPSPAEAACCCCFPFHL